eukprot:gb/GECH01011024.1/.p1 GENE.gb/GECH01011024.1/~~gb/GECH01011024.1/.p1  ORF type:complete len:754 (+),score=181.70 gb/GECH01011024.1/:1-2262(+)
MVNIWGQAQFMGNVNVPMKILSTPNDVRHVAMGVSGQLLLCTDSGDCYALGNNNQYQLGIGEDPNVQHRPRKLDFNDEKIVKVDVSNVHSIFLTDQGKVYTCGTSGSGVTSSKTPVEVTELQSKEIVDVVAGHACLFAKTRQGKVYSWGNGSNGHIGHQDTNNRNTPTLIDSLDDVKIIAASKQHNDTVFVDQNNQVYYCGWNNGGYFGFANANANNYLSRKTELELGGSIDDISIGFHHLVLLSNNRVYYVGSDYSCSKTPKEIEQLRNLNIQQVQAGNDFGAAITDNHLVYIWGSGSQGKLGNGTGSNSPTPFHLEMDPVNNIVCSNQCSVAWWRQEDSPQKQDESDKSGFEELYNDRKYCDLTIHTQRDEDGEGTAIECHRVVMARSPFFRKLIDENPPEESKSSPLEDDNNNSHISSSMTHIYVKLPYSVVDIAVRFAYGQSIQIDPENIDTLCDAVHAAYVLEMDDLGKYMLYQFSKFPPQQRANISMASFNKMRNLQENPYAKKITFFNNDSNNSQDLTQIDPFSSFVEHLSQLYPANQDPADNYTAKLYPDITLKSSDGVSFTVHRVILALNKKRFAPKLEQGQRFSDADRLDHHSNLLHIVIRYHYTGERDIYTGNVSDLVRFNGEFPMFGLHQLSAACKQKLREMAVQDEHALEVLEACMLYQQQDEDLVSVAKLAKSHLARKQSGVVDMIAEYFTPKNNQNHDEEETDELRRELAQLKESNASLHNKVDQLLDAMKKINQYRI